jgi:hypothetical protein
MAGKMISELSDAISLQDTDLIPLARGASTLRIAGSAISASVIISDTAPPPTGISNGQLWFDSSSGITSIFYDSTWVDVGGGDSANSLNVVDSPTIDLSYNSSTGTLSADFNSNISSISKIYDQTYSRSGTFTWSSAAVGSNPKNAGWLYSWPSTGFLTEKYRSNIVPMSADLHSLEWDSAVFLTHNLYYNYDGNTGIVATYL